MESVSKDIWESAFGAGLLSKVFLNNNYNIISTHLIAEETVCKKVI